tara:strand:- start:4049 stop:4387 length:339 start_codon:yes stop_codon:yes gene_type:complete
MHTIRPALAAWHLVPVSPNSCPHLDQTAVALPQSSVTVEAELPRRLVMPYHPRIAFSMSAIVLATALAGCTVKLAAPEKPITINLNVKIEHEIRVKVEKDLENLFEEKDALF